MTDESLEVDEPDSQTGEMLRYAVMRVLNYGDEIPMHEVTEEEGKRIRDHFESGELRRQQRQTMRPLARFIVECSRAQGELATALATVLNRETPQRIRPVVGKMPSSKMLEVLDGAVPATPYFRTLRKQAEKVFKNRNTAAHCTIVTMRFVAGSPEFGRWLVSADERYTDISGDTLLTWRREAVALSAAFQAVTVLASKSVAWPDHATFGGVATIASHLSLGVGSRSSWLPDILNRWFPPETSTLVEMH